MPGLWILFEISGGQVGFENLIVDPLGEKNIIIIIITMNKNYYCLLNIQSDTYIKVAMPWCRDEVISNDDTRINSSHITDRQALYTKWSSTMGLQCIDKLVMKKEM